MHQVYDVLPVEHEEAKTRSLKLRSSFEKYIRDNPSKGEALNYPDIIPYGDILAEVNKLRVNPKSYIPILEQRKRMFVNQHEYIIGGRTKTIKYGKQEIENCISFLSKSKPVPPLEYNETLQIPAIDHTMDMIANNYFYYFRKGGQYGGYGYRIQTRLGYYLSGQVQEQILQFYFCEGPNFVKQYVIQHIIDKDNENKKSRHALLNQKIKYFSGIMMKDPVNNCYKGETMIFVKKPIEPKGQPYNAVGAEFFSDYKELLQIASSRVLTISPPLKSAEQMYWAKLQYRKWIDPLLAQSDYVKKVKKITKKNKGIFDLHIHQSVIPEEIHDYPPFIPVEDILGWINMARTSPLEIVPLLKKELKLFINNLSYVKNGKTHRTKQGKAAVTDAIKYIQNIEPSSPLEFDQCLCLAAIDEMMNIVGQYGADNTSVYERVKRRHGKQFSGSVQKLYLDTKFQQLKDLDILSQEIIKFIVDSGDKSRPNRKGIFNPRFTVMGACIWRDAYQWYKTIIFLGEKHLETANFQGAYYRIMPRIDPSTYLQPPPQYKNNKNQNNKLTFNTSSNKKISGTLELVEKKVVRDPYENDILSTVTQQSSPKKKQTNLNQNINQLVEKKQQGIISMIDYNLTSTQHGNVVEKIIKTRNKIKEGKKITQIIETIQFEDGNIKISRRQV